MGIMDWFKQVAGGSGASGTEQAAPPPATDDRGAEVGGLNFKSAIDAHMKWKIRLESYINGTSTEDLKVDVVCRDDQCPLGKWIYSRGGGEFGYSDTFFDMKAHHAHFHRCAGEILSAAQAGDAAKAMQLLHHGDYVRASERVKKLLAKLFVLVADGNTAIDAHVKWKERLQDHIAGRGTENLTVGAVLRQIDHETRFAQALTQVVARFGLIFNDQYLHEGARPYRIAASVTILGAPDMKITKM